MHPPYSPSSTTPRLETPRLDFPKRAVPPPFDPDKLVVRALFDEFPGVEAKDFVGAGGEAEAVGREEDGLLQRRCGCVSAEDGREGDGGGRGTHAASEVEERVKDGCFGGRVKGCTGFVPYEEVRRWFEEALREGDALPLVGQRKKMSVGTS